MALGSIVRSVKSTHADKSDFEKSNAAVGKCLRAKGWSKPACHQRHQQRCQHHLHAQRQARIGTGIRIDLHERPWEATPQELLAVYHPAMRHLRQSPVLTTLKPRTRADGTLAVDVKKGHAFKMVDYRKPAPHV